MEIEYIGELLQDGHLSVDPTVKSKLKEGEKLKVKIGLLSSKKDKTAEELDPATTRILERLKNPPKLGSIESTLRREELYEEWLDGKYPTSN
ncbi:MAG: hypothetical protein ACUZ8N_15610 [Candidatus Scalindua sp.]